MPLTDRQKKSLNEAILEYLKDQGYEASCAAFATETGTEPPSSALRSLERKWTAVIRLTKKVQDLESKLEETEHELQTARPFALQQHDQDLARQFLLPNEEKQQFAGHRKAVTRVKFHPNYTWLASCSEDGNIGIWDFETSKNERWLKGHTDAVHDIDFNHNGTLLVSASSDMSVRLWDLNDEFRCIKTFNGHDRAVTGICFLPSDKVLSCSRDGTLKLWDVESGYCEQTWRPHNGEWVKKVVVSADGSLIATSSSDKTAVVLDAKSGELVSRLQGHEHVVDCLAFSNPLADDTLSRRPPPDDDEPRSLRPEYLATGARDRMIRVWQIAKGDCVMKLTGHDNWVRSLLFHPCGRYILSCADDKSIRVWDLRTSRINRVIPDAHQSFVQDIAWHPALCLLASCSARKDVKLWHPGSPAEGADDEFDGF